MKLSISRMLFALATALGCMMSEPAAAQLAPAMSRRLAAPQERVTAGDIPATNVSYPDPSTQRAYADGSSRAAVAYRQAPTAPTPVTSAPTGNAPMGESKPMPMPSGDMPMSNEPCSWDSGIADPGTWFNPGRGSWVVGAEFLFARPHFSEPIAYILRNGPVVGPGNQVSNSEVTRYHNFDYEPAVRGYLAYRLCDCCSELRFTYTGLNSESSRSATAVAGSIPTWFEVQPLPGNTLTANTNINGDVFDVDFNRCIRNGDECRDPCGDCCGGCPRWDLQWSAGARLARWDYDNEVFTNVTTDGRVDQTMDFIGAGPKVGLEGRRYFGSCNQFTVYSTLDVSLVLGWYESITTRTIPSAGVNPTSIERFESKITRLIPVTEIEMGASWNFAPGWTLSGGWFFSCWWDLGMAGQLSSNLLGANGPQYYLDDSNIMSWDGLTARIEFVW